LRLRAPPQLEEGVAALGRADEHRPAAAIGQGRADDFRPHPRVHVGIFVEHDAVEIDAAQGVRVVGAVEAHLPALRIIDAQLALVHARAILAQRRRRRAQIVPRHRFRLLEEGREIGVARANFPVRDGRVLQVVNAGDRLAGAAMRHNAGEPLPAIVEGLELAARCVVDDGIGFEHGMITRGLLAPRCSERASQRGSR
jgi:hypothetical protein